MKPTLLMASLALLLTGSVWLKADDADSSNSSTPTASEGHHHHHGPPISKEDREKLKAAHDAALQANPDLATEEKQLHEQFKAFEKKMHDAMVKADPSVEPILAKMHHHGPPPPDGGDDDGGNQ